MQNSTEYEIQITLRLEDDLLVEAPQVHERTDNMDSFKITYFSPLREQNVSHSKGDNNIEA